MGNQNDNGQRWMELDYTEIKNELVSSKTEIFSQNGPRRRIRTLGSWNKPTSPV